MEAFADAEDRQFFVEIERRILLLMDENDDDDKDWFEARYRSSDIKQRGRLPSAVEPMVRPQTAISSSRASNGTGVFIPYRPDALLRDHESKNVDKKTRLARGRRPQGPVTR